MRLFGFLNLVVLAGLAAVPAIAETRADGTTISWDLDVPQGDGPFPLIVLLQGSGCAPAAASENLTLVRQAFSDHAALRIEKYGVLPNDRPDERNGNADCSQDFIAGATVGQRIADTLQVIEALAGEDWWSGRLILFGGSEGGLVAASLARLTEADVAILLSTGGGLEFGEALRSSIPEEGWPSVDAQFQQIRGNPQSLDVWAGYSYRFWADIMDRRVADDIVAANANILLIQGEADRTSPPEVARMAVDIVAEAERCNLNYWELSGLDHAMTDEEGASHMVDIIARAAEWAARQTKGECAA